MKLKARNRIVTAALVLLLLLVVFGALLSGAPPARAAEAFTLTVRSAPVGMATDHERSRYWLLDKASGRLSLTALGTDGAVQGHMTSRDTLVNATGLAYDAGELYVGDVGGERPEVTVYQVMEPWPATDILKAVPFVLTYPDGVHVGTAILLDRDGRLHVVTGGDAPGIYAAPVAPSSSEPNVLERVADAPAGTTDATVLRDGRWVVRTATTLVTLDATTHEPIGEVEIGVEETGQVLAQSLADDTVLTAMGPGGLVTSTEIPGPAPTATPAPARTRAAAPRPVVAEAEDDTATFEQTGTTFALGAAVAVAALAGLVVLVRR